MFVLLLQKSSAGKRVDRCVLLRGRINDVKYNVQQGVNLMCDQSIEPLTLSIGANCIVYVYIPPATIMHG